MRCTRWWNCRTWTCAREGYRLRDDAHEARLAASIAERGIERPLSGVDTPQARILLNGFRRCRCAKRLSIACVPYVALAEEEAAGILELMRGSADKSLSILEQARFIAELVSVHGMSVAEIAQTLSRSKGWVSMRRSLLDEMSPAIEAMLFGGLFPVYSYMYTLRPFMRMNSARREQVERFMKAAAGRRLTVRDIGRLADGYFHGSASLREAVEAGQLAWALDQMKRVPEDRQGCSLTERTFLKDLEALLKSVQRVLERCHDKRLVSRDFYSLANVLSASLLSSFPSFLERIKELYDRSGQA